MGVRQSQNPQEQEDTDIKITSPRTKEEREGLEADLPTFVVANPTRAKPTNLRNNFNLPGRMRRRLMPGISGDRQTPSGLSVEEILFSSFNNFNDKKCLKLT